MRKENLHNILLGFDQFPWSQGGKTQQDNKEKLGISLETQDAQTMKGRAEVKALNKHTNQPTSLLPSIRVGLDHINKNEDSMNLCGSC